MLTTANTREPFAKKLIAGSIGAVATLGERVEEAIRVRRLTRMAVDEAVATSLGKAPRALNGMTADVIAGRRKPTADVLAALARALGVSAGWLLDEEGGMDPASGPVRTYDSLPGWAEAAEVEISRDRVRAYVIRAAGRSPVLVRPREVTPELVFQVATFWLTTASEEERDAASRADAERGRT